MKTITKKDSKGGNENDIKGGNENDNNGEMKR
jgi:hypothetical protein